MNSFSRVPNICQTNAWRSDYGQQQNTYKQILANLTGRKAGANSQAVIRDDGGIGLLRIGVAVLFEGPCPHRSEVVPPRQQQENET